MKRALVAVLFLSVTSGVALAGDDDGALKFKGGIGVIPVSNVNAQGLGTANVVRGIGPGGQPWVIKRLEATVKADGRISVEGRGLLLAGGDGIGTNGGQTVDARLFCGPAATATVHVTGGVPLEPDGDFRIEDVLDPPPPAVCDTPVLLIVSHTVNRWFAAGIPKRDHDDD